MPRWCPRTPLMMVSECLITFYPGLFVNLPPESLLCYKTQSSGYLLCIRSPPELHGLRQLFFWLSSAIWAGFSREGLFPPHAVACGGWCLDPGDVYQVGKQAQVVRAFNFSSVAVNLHFNVVSQFFKLLGSLLNTVRSWYAGPRAGWGLGLPPDIPDTQAVVII